MATRAQGMVIVGAMMLAAGGLGGCATKTFVRRGQMTAR